MSADRNHIKVFVSSTVYEFETELSRVFAQLDGYGYDVCMSKEGTVPLNSRLSNLVNCVKSVEECDVFLGIIRPLLGTGILEPDGRSITAQEFDTAFHKNMLRFILADYRVEFAHKFLNLMEQDLSAIPYYKAKKYDKDGMMIIERKPNLVIHRECVELYRLAIQNSIRPPKNRVGNWAQPYKDYEDISRFVEAQFKNVERIKTMFNG